MFAVSYAMAIYRRSTVCTFIPKNACSVLRYNVALENQVIRGPENKDWIHENNSTFRPSHGELVTAAYSFVILRCPFRRLASAFLHRIVDRPERAVIEQGKVHPKPWYLKWPLKRPAIQRSADGARGWAEADKLTFADFVTFLEAPGGLRTDIHWRPQVDFLVYQDYDDVFRVEDMPGMMAGVRDKIGLVIRDAEHLVAHGNLGRARINDGFFGHTTVAELQGLKTAMKAPAYERLYNAELHERVGRLYAADVALYAGFFGGDALLQPIRA
jgi:hypothetical protein